MKNLLYCCCISDPWKDVAKNLFDANKYKPVYWIGWAADSRKTITNEFPNITYHDISDAWKGIFPDEVNCVSKSQLNGTELSDHCYEEMMAMKMMERLDPDQKSFTFNERKDFFRFLLRAWLNILESKKIEIIIAPSIPHRVFDYALYVAAGLLNIKFLSFKMTVWPGYNLPFHNIEKLPRIETANDLAIHDAAIEYYDRVNSSYQKAEPAYMKIQAVDASKSIFKRVLNYFGEYKLSSIPKLFKPTTLYWKKRGRTIQDSHFRKYEYFIQYLKGYWFKKNLQKYYESLCDTYDENEKYIYVALHYQPEETSCPSGKIYVDQSIMVEALSKHLPDDIYIYVKEHSSQFNPKMEGQTGRNTSFYKTLKSLDRVKLISTFINSFELIDNSLAVATLTGTVGVEALVRGKPSIVFGTAWYECLKGVIKVQNKEDLNNLFMSLQKEKPDKDAILKGLSSIRQRTIKAYHYKAVKENTRITKEEAIQNLTQFLIDVE